MPFALAAISDHALDLCAVGVALAFIAGTYGHMVRSRATVLAAIVVIGVICLYVVATGEIQTFD